jgi:hypothetical protein
MRTFQPSQAFARKNPGTTATDIVAAYKISPSFASKIVEVAGRLGVDPAHLANVINFESRFSPSIQNAISGATGLIQFMPNTAAELGTTTGTLAAMSAEQQMEYVYRYFALPRIKQYGPLRTQEDVYMAVFYPVAIGKPDYVFPLKVQAQNFGFKTPKDYTTWANSRAKLSTAAVTALTTIGLSGDTARQVTTTASRALWLSSAASIAILAVAGAVAFRRATR